MAVAVGSVGEAAGEGPAVSALGFRLGFGALGAGTLGIDGRVSGGDLGLVVLAGGGSLLAQDYSYPGSSLWPGLTLPEVSTGGELAEDAGDGPLSLITRMPSYAPVAPASSQITTTDQED